MNSPRYRRIRTGASEFHQPAPNPSQDNQSRADLFLSIVLGRISRMALLGVQMEPETLDRRAALDREPRGRADYQLHRLGVAVLRRVPSTGFPTFGSYQAALDILTFFDHPNQSIEGTLVHFDGSKIPVELIQRSIDFGGRPHRVVAVRDLRARKEAEKHIRFLAHCDALTGLPNRVSFNKKLDQEIEAALAMGRRLAVLCLDLDRFKEVNDLFGHAAGDRALQSVAKRISRLVG